jgi:hypothetical protein
MRPRRLAMWLSRLGVDDSLAGDLIERQATGRSQLWLWSQVLAAVIMRSGKPARTPTAKASVVRFHPKGLAVFVVFVATLLLAVDQRSRLVGIVAGIVVEVPLSAMIFRGTRDRVR